MGFNELIAAIGGSAVLFGAMAWLTRSVINHFLSRDLEKFKLGIVNVSRHTPSNIFCHKSFVKKFSFAGLGKKLFTENWQKIF